MNPASARCRPSAWLALTAPPRRARPRAATGRARSGRAAARRARGPPASSAGASRRPRCRRRGAAGAGRRAHRAARAPGRGSGRSSRRGRRRGRGPPPGTPRRRLRGRRASRPNSFMTSMFSKTARAPSRRTRAPPAVDVGVQHDVVAERRRADDDRLGIVDEVIARARGPRRARSQSSALASPARKRDERRRGGRGDRRQLEPAPALRRAPARSLPPSRRARRRRRPSRSRSRRRGGGYRGCHRAPIRARYCRCAARTSSSASPPNLSSDARASSKATAASATTASASTACTSERSTSALAGSPRLEVDGVERAHERRQRLHRGADDDRLAVRHPRLDARRRGSSGAWRPGSISSCASVPRRRASAKPSPISTPFTAWIPISADASRASSRSDFSAYEPSPGGTPVATTSTIAAERVAVLPRGVGRLAHALVGRLAADLDRPPLDRDAELARGAPSRPRPAATWTAVCRAEARSSAFRTSSCAVLEDAREVGVPGPRQRHRPSRPSRPARPPAARGSSPTSSSRGRGSGRRA